ncbi:superoxide dismutase family protein [Marinobacter zhanjiangensis]|uniref:Superoxide dismutase [Cu-Zn] n=1 Tax=Marinobacter zhanjiangensis TaxID=578215 RepID=A0ABQ3AUR8_9GAMM|nr:superoxide dismutase family protein [Marinobacter zhanjiangensis]GGY67019.1 superoxide dismutase [Cu-Zn] [Marinobacter zhanjiangensis]
MIHAKSGLWGLAASTVLMCAPLAQANESVDVDMYQVTAEGQGDLIGTVTIEKNDHGALITSDLKGLGPGPHGFHLHENPDCGPVTKDGEKIAAGAAGGHYDPDNTGAHKGPFDTGGHLGDLPRLHVGQAGESKQTYLAPRLQLDDFQGRALVIHRGSDNYSDDPRPLGGGGARMACGVVQGE